MKKINIILANIAALGILSTTSLTAQTLEPYRILVLPDGDSQIKDGHIEQGTVIYGSNTTNKIDTVSFLNADIYGHSTASLDGGTFTSGVDAEINQVVLDAQIEALTYSFATATASEGELKDADFSFTSTGSLNVIDFTSIDLNNNTFSLTGSVDDVFVIRTPSLTFSESYVELIGVDYENVYWLVDGNADIMHGGPIDDGTDYGFSGTIYSDSGQIRVGAEGPFEGTIIGKDILVGSGFALVPEPSSAFLLAISGLIFGTRRRRK